MRALGVCCFLAAPCVASALSDGVYAVFVTGMGGFTCRLEHVRAPRTTANFVGLAEGSNAWVHLNTGQDMRAPFFNGGIFHRVVSNFVIQGGGQQVGSSFGGPGYSFRDEFHPELRHDTTGILAMANSGPNSQGSQFYITLTSFASGDDKYSIFGRVLDGMEVVQAIGNVTLDSGSRPLVDVVLSNVTILRVGTEARQFDTSAYGLPRVGGTTVGIKRTSGCFVTFDQDTNCSYHFVYSSNLVSWSRAELGFDTNAVPSAVLDVTVISTSCPMYFFSLAQVSHPAPIYTPMSANNRSFHMTFTSGSTLDHWMGNNGTGTWKYVRLGETYTGRILYSAWTPKAWLGQLYAQYDSYWPPCLYDFAYDAPGSNRFRQVVYDPVYGPLSFYGSYSNAP